MPARWLKLTVSYDGRAYAGWQIQPDKPTVQGTFQAIWQKLTQEQVNVTAAGRTAIDEHWARLEALKKAAAGWPRR